MTPNQAFDQWADKTGVIYLTEPTKGLVRNAFLAGAASSAPTWQPMESAPKDQTLILTKGPKGQVKMVRWESICTYGGEKAWCIMGTGRLRDSSDAVWYDTFSPTGWMPLPSP